MKVVFNPFTGSFDLVSDAGEVVPDPLIVDNLTVNQILTAGHIHAEAELAFSNKCSAWPALPS